MPRIKRYFPVSHDINEDPICWEMTERFGDRSLRMWLELESIADRNEAVIGPMSDSYSGVIAGKSHLSRIKVRSIWDFLVTKEKITPDAPHKWVNYSDFHTTREANENLEGKGKDSLPSEPSYPTYPNSPVVPKTLDDFETKFWPAYPKHKRKSKGAARRAWKKINPSPELVTKMLAKLELLKKSIGWQKDAGQFVPYPATWLNAEGWDDEVDDFIGRPRKMMPD
jgi:hypothetical protein